MLAHAVVAALMAQAHPARSGYAPAVEQDDGEAARALTRIVVPPGFEAELFAAEPHAANLVALDVDPFGRCYLVETFRRDKQVLDIREHLDWREDDLACRTVADRVTMILKHAGAKAEEFRKESERVRLVRDRDGDGRAETSTVFADEFRDYADGVAAGVLFHRGDVYFADMPNLWRLRDEDGDGVADRREVLSSGYGVHFNFVGHDLHGLRIGPDGRLWFSLGDRGLDVTTKEGKRLQLPDTGAVLRCELDGSGLELVHTGLRNPQELAFNDVGDCFSCDNNSDSGDRARLVHVVEGGETGWSVGFQWIERPTPRGPWNAEKMWHPRNDESRAVQPAFLVPCVTNLVSGPSGLTHEPGTCFPARYRDHFFVCDFEAEWDNTRVVAFSVKPRGATYELASEEAFVARGIVATDCDFAADGCMYVSDWVRGWGQTGRGRVWRIFDPATRADPIVARTRDLLREDFTRNDSQELMQRLAHPDQRVRLQAQLALAERGAVDSLRTMARWSAAPLARLHAVWGLGQIARRGDEAAPAAISALLPLLRDDVAEVRAQTAKVVGEAGPRAAKAFAPLVALLSDREPRVRYFAAIALGSLGDPRALDPLVEMVRRDGDADVYLRHAGVIGLLRCATNAEIVAIARADPAAVRMAALLVMRRRRMAEILAFLDHRERAIVVEAARAIHDQPIPDALDALARQLDDPRATEPPLLLRAINANFRLGGRERAARLADVAATRSDLDEAIRADALRALDEFDAPPARDRILGVWRPCDPPTRPPLAYEALRPHLNALLTREGDLLRELAVRFVERHGVADRDRFLQEIHQLALDPARGAAVRVAALECLQTLADPQLRRVVETALASDEPKLRGAARRVLAKLDPAVALQILDQALARGTTSEKQDAFTTLGEMDFPPATSFLATWLSRLLAGGVAPDVTLDLLEAADRRKGDPVVAERLAQFDAARPKDDPLAVWRECEQGGDAEHGRRLFFERTDFQCVKCHRVGGEGAGEAGPDLAGIGGRKERGYLLESVALPNRQIAAGFGNTIFVLEKEQLVDGRVIGETPTHWLVVTTDLGTVRIRKSAVVSMRQGLSAMPADLVQRMSKRELRDLVAWLASAR